MTLPPPPYQPQPYYFQPAPPTNGAAIAGMVLGIVGIAVGFWSIIPIVGMVAAFLGFLPALLAVIFGASGLKRSRMIGGVGRGPALAALWLGWITLGMIFLTVIGWFAAIGSYME